MRARSGELEGVRRNLSGIGVPLYEFEIRLSSEREREAGVNTATGLIIKVEGLIYGVGAN